MKEIVSFILIVVIIITVGWFSAIWYSKVPVAFFSYTTGKCVKVITNGIETPCESLTIPYKREWIK